MFEANTASAYNVNRSSKVWPRRWSICQSANASTRNRSRAIITTSKLRWIPCRRVKSTSRLCAIIGYLTLNRLQEKEFPICTFYEAVLPLEGSSEDRKSSSIWLLQIQRSGTLRQRNPPFYRAVFAETVQSYWCGVVLRRCGCLQRWIIQLSRRLLYFDRGDRRTNGRPPAGAVREPCRFNTLGRCGKI